MKFISPIIVRVVSQEEIRVDVIYRKKKHATLFLG
jgi:hypothetical protein